VMVNRILLQRAVLQKILRYSGTGLIERINLANTPGNKIVPPLHSSYRGTPLPAFVIAIPFFLSIK
jgi:hypothetical protein